VSDPGVLRVRPGIVVHDDELEWQAVRAQGAGGQHVNKVASAVHLRFDIRRSSLPEDLKQRLLQRRDQRITADGVVVIKAQRFRQREKNLVDARERLRTLLLSASQRAKPRRPTQPTRASRTRRLDQKARRGQLKRLRRQIDD
jgi:ribosome-associated protein